MASTYTELLDDILDHAKSCTWIKAAAGVAVTFATYKVYSAYSEASRKAKLRKLWDSRGKDVVTLHQFPRAVSGPSPSPFPVKLEAYLKIMGIKYFPDFDEPMSSKHKSPWISVNGVDVADSQLSIEYLTMELGKDIEAHLSESEKATSRFMRCMLEDHLYWCLVLERWVYDGGQEAIYYFASMIPKWAPMFLVRYVFRKMGHQWVWQTSLGQGLGRHTKKEVEDIGRGDLTAMSDYLGNKKFLFGDRPSIADVTLFGFITYIVILPKDSKSVYKRHLEEKCQNLLKHHETIRQMYWPDYDSPNDPQ